MPQSDKHFDFAFGGFKFLETEGSNFCGGGIHAQTLSRLCYNTNKNKKGFRSRPMCPKPFISAVSPIFCLFPLYQLSEFHFAIFLSHSKLYLLWLYPTFFLRYISVYTISTRPPTQRLEMHTTKSRYLIAYGIRFFAVYF